MLIHTMSARRLLAQALMRPRCGPQLARSASGEAGACSGVPAEIFQRKVRLGCASGALRLLQIFVLAPPVFFFCCEDVSLRLDALCRPSSSRLPGAAPRAFRAPLASGKLASARARGALLQRASPLN